MKSNINVKSEATFQLYSIKGACMSESLAHLLINLELLVA